MDFLFYGISSYGGLAFLSCKENDFVEMLKPLHSGDALGKSSSLASSATDASPRDKSPHTTWSKLAGIVFATNSGKGENALGQLPSRSVLSKFTVWPASKSYASASHHMLGARM